MTIERSIQKLSSYMSKRQLAVRRVRGGTGLTSETEEAVSQFFNLRALENNIVSEDIENAILARAQYSAYILSEPLKKMSRKLARFAKSGKTLAFLGRDGDILQAVFNALTKGKYADSTILVQGTPRGNRYALLRDMLSAQGITMENVENHVFVDTGFSGSIFANIEDALKTGITGVLLTSNKFCEHIGKWYAISKRDSVVREETMYIEHAPRLSAYISGQDGKYPCTIFSPSKRRFWLKYVDAFIRGAQGEKCEEKACVSCGHFHPIYDLSIFGLCSLCERQNKKEKNERETKHEKCRCTRCGDFTFEENMRAAWVYKWVKTGNPFSHAVDTFRLDRVCSYCSIAGYHCEECNATLTSGAQFSIPEKGSSDFKILCPACMQKRGLLAHDTIVETLEF